MKECNKYIGLDVHKETIAVSVAEANGGEVRYVGEIANTPEAMEKLVRQLRKGGENLSFCYEAGPCGYGIHRQLTDLGWECRVVAPSLIPKKAGLDNPAVSSETRRYLNFFAEILGKSSHPKVTATIERAISNYRAGSKTLIFCERLKTQEEIVAKLKESLVEDFVGAGGIDAVKRERREFLKDHRLVEIYLSRSLLAAQGKTAEISSIASSTRELVDENLQLIEDNLRHLSDRQRNKGVDLILVGIIGPEETLKQVFHSLRESPSALRTYLRLDSETELEPVDDDPDDDDNEKGGGSAIDAVLTAARVKKVVA